MAPVRVYVAAGRWLAPGPAASIEAARAAGCPGLDPAGINSAGRTTAEQLALWLRQGWKGLAARPGKSRHETGEALDLEPAPRAWLDAHPEYGWRQTIKRESWHREYFAHLATYTRPRPAPATKRGRHMFIAIGPGTPGALIYPSGAWALVSSAADAANLAAAGVPTAHVSLATYQALTPPAARLAALGVA